VSIEHRGHRLALSAAWLRGIAARRPRDGKVPSVSDVEGKHNRSIHAELRIACHLAEHGLEPVYPLELANARGHEPQPPRLTLVRSFREFADDVRAVSR
jgi:hypothetical protein